MSALDTLDLESCTASRVGTVNLLVSRRVEVTLDDGAGTFVLTSGVGVPPPSVHFICSSGEGAVGISASAGWVDRYLPEGIADLPLQALPEPLAEALIEIVLAPLLAALAPLFPEPLQAKGVAEEHPEGWCAVALTPMSGDATPPPVTLHLDPVAEAAFVARLEARPVDLDREPELAAPVVLHAVIGSQNLNRDEAQSLVPGAVVVLGEAAEPREVQLFAGANFMPLGRAALEDGRLTLQRLRRDPMDSDPDTETDAADLPEGEAAMDTDAPTAESPETSVPDAPEAETLEAEGEAEIDLDHLEVRLDFVAGRATLRFAELRGLGTGSTIALDQPASRNVGIYSSGRRLGEGEMVDIDGALGVRITRINRRQDA